MGDSREYIGRVIPTKTEKSKGKEPKRPGPNEKHSDTEEPRGGGISVGLRSVGREQPKRSASRPAQDAEVALVRGKDV